MERPFKYVDPTPDVPEQPAQCMVACVETNDPMKPWTLVSRVADDCDMETETIRQSVLQPLALEGVLTPTADGDIRVHEKSRLGPLLD